MSSDNDAGDRPGGFEHLAVDDWWDIRSSCQPFGQKPDLESMLGVLIAEIRAMRLAVQRLEDSHAPGHPTASAQPCDSCLTFERLDSAEPVRICRNDSLCPLFKAAPAPATLVDVLAELRAIRELLERQGSMPT